MGLLVQDGGDRKTKIGFFVVGGVIYRTYWLPFHLKCMKNENYNSGTKESVKHTQALVPTLVEIGGGGGGRG